MSDDLERDRDMVQDFLDYLKGKEIKWPPDKESQWRLMIDYMKDGRLSIRPRRVNDDDKEIKWLPAPPVSPEILEFIEFCERSIAEACAWNDAWGSRDLTAVEAGPRPDRAHRFK